MSLSASSIADFFVKLAIDDEGRDLITNLKLQKLLYYAQGCHLAIYGAPLFGDEIEAWQHGPVVSSIYHKFKVCGRQPIEEIAEDAVNVSEAVADFLCVIQNKFGQYSAEKLIRMTHAEAPWRDNFHPNENVVIEQHEIADFFQVNWIDGDVVVEDQGVDPNFINEIEAAYVSSDSDVHMSGVEFGEWLATH